MLYRSLQEQHSFCLNPTFLTPLVPSSLQQEVGTGQEPGRRSLFNIQWLAQGHFSSVVYSAQHPAAPHHNKDVCVCMNMLSKKHILFFKWASLPNCLLAHTQQQRGHVSQESPDVPWCTAGHLFLVSSTKDGLLWVCVCLSAAWALNLWHFWIRSLFYLFKSFFCVFPSVAADAASRARTSLVGSNSNSSKYWWWQ